VFIILDATSVHRGKLQVLRLSLAHCLRALPLAWLVLSGPGLVGVACAAALFSEAALLLKHVGPMTFLADRGFRSSAWAEKCLKMGWNYIRKASAFSAKPNPSRTTIENMRPNQVFDLTQRGHFWE